MNPFAWLRARVAQAVLAGLNDALEQIDRDAPADLAEGAARLENRIRRALPAPAETTRARTPRPRVRGPGSSPPGNSEGPVRSGRSGRSGPGATPPRGK
jgi:hypothetical protein